MTPPPRINHDIAHACSGQVNLGISHSNLGRFEEAATHYLGALTMQPGSRTPHIWHLLRLALSLLHRHDLVDLTEHQNVELFRDHFDF